MIDISRQVAENFEGQMTQWLLCPFDQLSRIRLRKRYTQILPGSLPRGLSAGPDDSRIVGLFGEGVQMSDQSNKVFVGNVGFKPQTVFERDGKCEEEIYRGTVNATSEDDSGLRDAAESYTFPNRSSLPFSPGRSLMLTQIVRAMFRDVWIKRAQYFRPSAYLRPVSSPQVVKVILVFTSRRRSSFGMITPTRQRNRGR
jgi:hypothetical protein